MSYLSLVTIWTHDTQQDAKSEDGVGVLVQVMMIEECGAVMEW
jgi:hypothetical protein